MEGLGVCVRTGLTAGPSTSLRSGRDDKVSGTFLIGSNCLDKTLTLTLSSRPERSGVEGPAVRLVGSRSIHEENG